MLFIHTNGHAQIIGFRLPDIDTRGLAQHQIDSIKDDFFHGYLTDMDLIYEQPDGFSRLSTPYRDIFICQQGNSPNTFARVIANSDATIIIGITTYPVISEEDRIKMASWAGSDGDFDPDQNWKNLIRNYRSLDSTMLPEQYYDAEFVSNTSNADVAGEFIRGNCFRIGTYAGENFYRKEYRYYKTAFMHKKGRGNVQVVYFYKRGRTPEALALDDLIRSNAGMLRYR